MLNYYDHMNLIQYVPKEKNCMNKLRSEKKCIQNIKKTSKILNITRVSERSKQLEKY